MKYLPNVLLIHFLTYISLAGGRTLLHMIIQTWTVFAAVTGQITVAGPYHINLADQLDHVLHSCGAGIGSEIFRLVLFHGAGKKNSWIGLVYRHFNEWICLIILQHGVIFRAVLLDQVALQYQRLQFRIGDNILKSGNVSDHLLNLCAFIAAALEILADTVLQTDSLSHINDLIVFPMHNVNARLTGQLF